MPDEPPASRRWRRRTRPKRLRRRATRLRSTSSWLAVWPLLVRWTVDPFRGQLNSRLLVVDRRLLVEGGATAVRAVPVLDEFEDRHPGFGLRLEERITGPKPL